MKQMSRSLISISDFNNIDLESILESTSLFKNNKVSSKHEGKCIGLLFEKFSTRTRLSFEVAISRLGAYPIYINKSDTQISRGESIEETAKMFSLYLDALVYRTSSHKDLEDFNKFSDIPVINALSDLEHPTQIISDIFSILDTHPNCESTKDLKDLKIVYIGDGNNIANSLTLAADIMKLNLTICTPLGYEPKDKKYWIDNPKKALADADVVYTDVWTSMGSEGEELKRIKDFENYQVNSESIRLANKDYSFMHCLPAHIGEEVTKDIIESSNSIVYQQAENKKYTAMAIIDYILK
tara:strand:+ start:746 stop:1636 length:891 start_codon:yes stop_codon:yes gene_type:complete